MSFNTNKFETTNFKERTSKVQVSELKDFYEEDEKPVWEVRGLTGEELAIVNEAISANQNLSSLVSAITSKVTKEKIEAIKETMGLPTDSVPSDIVRRISMLVQGSVNPDCPQSLAVKIARVHPTMFFKITNKIIELTGVGQLGE